jgi:hypothetical protein
MVLNVRAPTEDEIEDMKDRFYDKVEQYSINSPNTG